MCFAEQVNYVKPVSMDILQLNVGLLCNKQCTHCHLEAGPERDELMTPNTMKQVLWLADHIDPSLVDITGGAPELNPDIKWLIKQLSGYKTQLRTNLTALLLDESLIHFLKTHKVKLVASLPCYEADEVDSVRGDGTFEESINVLKKLNKQGYSQNTELELDLVFNPEADFLPPSQEELEKTYRKRLWDDYGIRFTHLITITNMPIGRFKKDLKQKNRLEKYMDLLRESHNPETIPALMCRHQLNINWNGDLYDCDFNQALGHPMRIEHVNINDPEFSIDELLEREILYGEHCYGCTAGQGSSCSGALTS